MNFGEALEVIKKGGAVQRKGWNGKGMYIYLNLGSVDITNLQETTYEEIDEQGYIDGIKFDFMLTGDKGTLLRMPNINMFTATKSIVTGWLASQTDMLSEDWNELTNFTRTPGQ